MTKRLEGIITPVVTPLLPDNTVAKDLVMKHQDFLIRRGIAAIFALGTTGEGPALPQQAREDMIVASVQAVRKRVPLLVGISSASLDDSLALAHFAAAHGADAVVAAPPCYLAPDDDEILMFYRLLAQEQPLPIYIYNMPATTKIDMPPELIIRLADIPHVIGYKDSAGNLANFQTVAAALHDRQDFSVFMGPDLLLGDALRLGACGGVNSGSNLAPDYFVGLYNALRSHDLQAATTCLNGIRDIDRLYHFRPNICCCVAASLKSALANFGLCTPVMTRPFAPMEPYPEIDEVVANYVQAFGPIN